MTKDSLALLNLLPPPLRTIGVCPHTQFPQCWGLDPGLVLEAQANPGSSVVSPGTVFSQDAHCQCPPPPPHTPLQPGKAQHWVSCALHLLVSESPEVLVFTVWASAVGPKPFSDPFSPTGLSEAFGDTI